MNVAAQVGSPWDEPHVGREAGNLNQLDRLQLMRLGQPVLPPVKVDCRPKGQSAPPAVAPGE